VSCSAGRPNLERDEFVPSHGSAYPLIVVRRETRKVESILGITNLRFGSKYIHVMRTIMPMPRRRGNSGTFPAEMQEVYNTKRAPGQGSWSRRNASGKVGGGAEIHQAHNEIRKGNESLSILRQKTSY
jgi:hypothetical protein